MDRGDKHQLEGLLKARAEDMRNGRRRRLRAHAEAPPADDGAASVAARAARTCAVCGAEIPSLRLRAMPDATRCLTCRRAAEPAGHPT